MAPAPTNPVQTHQQRQPDGEAITLEWLDADSEGYIDILPREWFRRPGNRRDFVHWTIGPRGGRYSARCDIRVSGKTAQLDYEAYAVENEAHQMFVGVAKLVFSDASRHRLIRASWKPSGGRFTPCEIRVGEVLSARNQLSAEDDLPEGNPSPDRRKGIRSYFVRDPRIREAVLKRAKGRCEFCGRVGFERADGGTYLETHHILGLANDGPDTMSNVIAVCANDHREAHFGSRRNDLNAAMLKKVPRRADSGR